MPFFFVKSIPCLHLLQNVGGYSYLLLLYTFVTLFENKSYQKPMKCTSWVPDSKAIRQDFPLSRNNYK